MTIQENSYLRQKPVRATKPVIALMGEFSVGKSTLSNLLIGAEPLPVKVTATQLPPIWISWGDDAPYREDLNGNDIPVDINNLADVPLSETSVIRIFMKSEVLQLCDLIDMPGISDPNMSSEVWESVISHADGVLWCTHATQAWRQSEAAVWNSLDPELHEKSLLLVTRIDKIRTETDRRKVIKRVERETQGLFAGIFPISLTEAIAAKGQREPWAKCGGEALIDGLIELTMKLSNSTDHRVVSQFVPPEVTTPVEPTRIIRPARVVTRTQSQRRPRPEHQSPETDTENHSDGAAAS